MVVEAKHLNQDESRSPTCFIFLSRFNLFLCNLICFSDIIQTLINYMSHKHVNLSCLLTFSVWPAVTFGWPSFTEWAEAHWPAQPFWFAAICRGSLLVKNRGASTPICWLWSSRRSDHKGPPLCGCPSWQCGLLITAVPLKGEGSVTTLAGNSGTVAKEVSLRWTDVAVSQGQFERH